MPGGNLKPRIVSKKINTITGKIILTNNIDIVNPYLKWGYGVFFLQFHKICNIVIKKAPIIEWLGLF